jgi:hypothetical protein
MNYTEEQKAKLKVLQKKYNRKGLFIGLKNTFFFVLFTISTVLLDAYLFDPISKSFAFICGLINGMIFTSMMRSDYLAADKEIKEDIKKLFEQ